MSKSFNMDSHVYEQSVDILRVLGVTISKKKIVRLDIFWTQINRSPVR